MLFRSGVTFAIDSKQWGKTTEKKNKLSEMYEIYAHPGMPANTIAARRMSCVCAACWEQMNKPWDYDIPMKEQPMFAYRADCKVELQMAVMNKWNFVEITLSKKTNGDAAKKKVNAILYRIMEKHIARVAQALKIDQYGAIATQDPKADGGIWLVRWTSEPYQLKEPSKVEGSGDSELPKGTVVAKGVYFNRIRQAPGWYEKDNKHTSFVFSMQHVVDSNVAVLKYDEGANRIPPPAASKEYNRRGAKQFVKNIPQNVRKDLRIKRMKLDKLTPYQLDGEEDEPAEEPKRYDKTWSKGFLDQDDEEDEEEEDEE